MPDRPRLVLVVGPIAAGKSTVARGLAASLRERGEHVAVVGLDELAAMALPTLPDWRWVHDVHAQTVRAWMSTPMTTVIAEGPGTAQEIGILTAAQPADVAPYVVLLYSDYATALARATADPTRGVSRQPDFLWRVYSRFEAERSGLTHDVALDTGRTSTAGIVREIVGRIRS